LSIYVVARRRDYSGPRAQSLVTGLDRGAHALPALTLYPLLQDAIQKLAVAKLCMTSI